MSTTSSSTSTRSTKSRWGVLLCVRDVVDCVHDASCLAAKGLGNQGHETFGGLVVCLIQQEGAAHPAHIVDGLELRDPAVDHEQKEGHDQVLLLSKREKSATAQFLELAEAAPPELAAEHAP